MTDETPRFQALIADIDAANAADPRRDTVDGQAVARELVYAQRMSACLSRLYPAAPEALRIAARAQHIRRWEIARDGYPLGRDGYNAWRAACREHHATLASALMRQHGFSEAETAHVAKIIRKQDLKRDADSQALENVVAVVFAAHYLDAFMVTHKDYSDDKVAGILKKTMRKMDPVGHAALHALTLSPEAKRVVALALA
jgi:Domain of unknown function (DUF4202)